MRSLFLVPALSAALCGCASQSKQVAGCPALTMLQQNEIVIATLQKAFGQRREGYHVYSDGQTTDPRGNMVWTYKQIGPALETQPGPGEGGRMSMVVQPCTGKVLTYSRL